MEVFYQIVFYIFALLALSGAVFAMLSKRTLDAVLSITVTFWAMSGMYFLLGLHYLASVQILLFGVTAAILLSFTVMLTGDESGLKTGLNIDAKTIVLLAMFAVFGLLIMPFVKTALVMKNVYFGFTLVPFANELFKSALAPFELVSMLFIAALLGVVALLYRRAK